MKRTGVFAKVDELEKIKNYLHAHSEEKQNLNTVHLFGHEKHPKALKKLIGDLALAKGLPSGAYVVQPGSGEFWREEAV